MVQVKERNPIQDKESKFVIDLGVAHEDELLIGKEFLDYLKSNLKVNGIKGNLGEDVVLTLSGQKVTLTSKRRIPKRYLKYLTKKYLKKADILEFLKVIAVNKASYKIKYIKQEQELSADEEN